MNERKIILYVLLLVAVTASAYMLIVVIPSRLADNAYKGARRIGDDIRKALQFTPEVTIKNTTVLEYEKEILELALVNRSFRHNYEWKNSWMGSTKNISISGMFEARVGFDLSRKFVLEITDDNAVLRLDRAQLLSLTPSGEVTYRDENGIWNWVNNEERNAALNAFFTHARKNAVTPELLVKAEKEMERRITEIMNGHGKQVSFEYSERLNAKD